MANQLGIELSPTSCRIVEVEQARARDGHRRDTHVVSFSVLPASGAETTARLATLRGRTAAVVVWSALHDHRQVMVAAASYESMRKAALRSLSAAGVRTGGMWADIAPAGEPTRQPDGRVRRPVMVTLAPAADMKASLRILRDAGIRVRTVMTPGAALGSLAQLRSNSGDSASVEAYVALEATVACVALVRRGTLLAARDLPWGFLDGDRGMPREREAIAALLAGELAELFAGVAGSGGGAVTQVYICGGLDELRSMTVPMIERLDVEVEALDSLFGIDGARLPAPADEFRERTTALRLAWAAVAAAPPPINLLRAGLRHDSKMMLARGAVAAGLVAGLGIGGSVANSAPWRQIERNAPAHTMARAQVAPGVPNPSHLSNPPQIPFLREPALEIHSAREPVTRRAADAHQPIAPDVGTAADLRTILYAADRRLAIIDGRIVAPGDTVGDARIVDITADAVFLKNQQGQTRRLALGASDR